MMKQFLYFFLCVSLLLSCSPKEKETPNVPSACYAVPADAKAGTAIIFNSSCSHNAVSYLWDFGDGNTSQEVNPAHTYLSKGSYQVKLTVTATDQSKYEFSRTVNVADAPAGSITSHSGQIDADEVWQAGIHKIYGHLTINNAKVTIMPGAIIKFTEDSELNIGTEYGTTSATLIANGTPAQPIIFTADSNTPVKGFYNGIYFGSGGSGNSSLTHCVFEYGGIDYGDGQIVAISGTQVTFENNKVRHGKGHGLYVGEGGGFKSFINNEISDCDLNVLVVNPNAVHTIDYNNTFVSDKGIEIIPSTLYIAEARWKKLSHPYMIRGNLKIGSEAGTKLTIEPGTVFKFMNGTISVGLYTTKATLIAEGTPEAPIIFTSNEASPAAGDWGGIHFNSGNNPASSLKHCKFEYGGQNFSNYLASIRIEWTSVNINNCLIQHSSPYAIWLNEEGHFTSFANNTIDNASYNGISIYGNWVHTIGTQSTINAARQVTVIGGDITASVTWPKQPFPYYTTGWFYIGSETGNTLTIAPGTTIVMENGKSFNVGGSMYSTEKGGLIANGTAAEPITFTSASNTAGSWEYIAFYPGTLTGSSLNYCKILYAGSTPSSGSVYVKGTNLPSITNCTIQHSGGYGIVLEKANPTVANNTFTSNSDINYYSY